MFYLNCKVFKNRSPVPDQTTIIIGLLKHYNYVIFKIKLFLFKQKIVYKYLSIINGFI